MNTLRIAFRNLSRQKKRSFLLGGAIAFGILIITLVNSFTAGFVENVQENFSHFFAGHVFLTAYEKSPSGRLITVIRDDGVLIQTIESLENLPIQYLSRRSSLEGTLIFEGESIRQEVVGVNWQEERFLSERLILRDGSMERVLTDPRALILNEKMAARLNVQLGDTLLVQLQTVTGQQNVGEFILAATSVDTGFFSAVSAYAHRNHVNQLLNIAEEEYISLGLFLENMLLMERAAQVLTRSLEEKISLVPRFSGPQGFQEQRNQLLEEQWEGTRFQLFTIGDFLEPLNQVASTLNTVGLVVVLILFIIIMVGVTNTFRMVIYERTREIGTMRSLGLQRGGVRGLFLLEALLLAVGGAVVGLVAAFIVALVLSLINFGTDNQFFIILREGHLLFKVLPAQIAGNILIVAVLTLLAALLPAGRAAKMDPAQALHKTY
ncbi:MAG: FtsX-like permease family protein [Spirochaetaceae bacterium]|nr:MAG: FtsX-like permease family protein [Spirochaetaceae bacterium]